MILIPVCNGELVDKITILRRPSDIGGFTRLIPSDENPDSSGIAHKKYLFSNKSTIFFLPPNYGLGDIIEYGLAVKKIQDKFSNKKIGFAKELSNSINF